MPRDERKKRIILKVLGNIKHGFYDFPFFCETKKVEELYPDCKIYDITDSEGNPVDPQTIPLFLITVLRCYGIKVCGMRSRKNCVEIFTNSKKAPYDFNIKSTVDDVVNMIYDEMV